MKSDDDILALVNERFDKSHDAKSLINQMIRLALAYYLGEQYAYIDKTNRTFNYPTEDQKREVEDANYFLGTINLVKPACDWVMSQGTARQASTYMMPKTAGDHARDVARAGSDLLNYLRFHQDYLTKDLECWAWMVVCGKAYKMVYPKSTGSTNLGDDIVSTGADIQVRVISPLDFLGTPGIRNVDDMPWIIITRTTDRSIPEEMYDVDLSGAEGGGEGAMDYEFKPTIGMFGTEKRDGQVLVKEYYEKPTRKNPDGAHYVVCEGKVLKKGRFPYWKVSMDEVSGAQILEPDGYRIVDYTYSDSLLDHWAYGLPDPNVIDLQKKINLLHSSWISARQLSLTAKLMHDERQDLSDEERSNWPGTMKRKGQLPPPEWMTPFQMPSDIQSHMGFLITAFEKTTGVPGTAQGEEPLKRMPAIAIQFLIEQVQTKFRPIFNRYDDQERHTSANIIASYKQFARDKTFKILGRERAREAAALMDDDPDDYDVIVERGSSLPESKAGQIGTVLELIQYGRFDMENPTNRIGLLRAIDTGWSKDMIRGDEAPMEMAEEENRRLLRGEDVPVNPYQNHEIHIATHRKLFDSVEYMQIAHTPIERKILDHIEGIHRQEIEEYSGKRFEVNQPGHMDYLAPPPQMQGQPPPPGGPPMPPPGPPPGAPGQGVV